MRRYLILILVVAGCTSKESSPQGAGQAPLTESRKDYMLTVTLDPPTPVVGRPARVLYTVQPMASWELKTVTPTEISLTPETGLELGKSKLDAQDIVNPEAKSKTLSTSVTARTTGEHTLKADLAFFLCNDEICKRFTDASELKIRVQ